MSKNSAIEWTDDTWNPTRGCTEIAPGCAHCYAKTFAERFRGVPGHPYEQGFDPRIAPNKLTEPLKWKKPRRIFVDSMSDLFHESFDAGYIAACLGVMASAWWHTFQILTKRPERAAHILNDLGITVLDCIMAARSHGVEVGYPIVVDREVRRDLTFPLPNVHIGTSIANQTDADKNTPHLLQIPAAVRFLSVEPLIGPVDLNAIQIPDERDGLRFSALQEHHDDRFGSSRNLINWVIVGGESGHGARPCNVEWIRSIVAQCKAADVPVFVKQIGAHVIDSNNAGFEGDEDDAWPMDTRVRHLTAQNFQGDDVRILLGRKGGEPECWPRDLNVREFPREVSS